MSKSFIVSIVVSVFISSFFLISNKQRDTPRIVFCNVGQGDGIYMRLPEHKDVLIDAGPDAKMIACLNKNMPFFDRTIELVFITHADKDHAAGILPILQSYRVKKIFSTSYLDPENRSFWKSIKSELELNKLSIESLNRSDSIEFKETQLVVLWPPTNLKSPSQRLKTSNNTALGLLAIIKNKKIVLLADMDADVGEQALENFHGADILKINHHGSKYGTSAKLLNLAEPALAVLSVGRNNMYGHPHITITKLLQSYKIQLKRTDVDGDVTIPL